MKNYKISPALTRSLTESQLESLSTSHNVHVGWWNSEPGSLDTRRASLLSRYVQVYFEATCRELEWFVSQGSYTDDEALPAMYLCCHTIELALKAIHFCQVDELRRTHRPFGEDQAAKPQNTHKLDVLLANLSPLFSPQNDFLTDDTKEFLSKINDMNKRAQNRYPFDDNRAGWQNECIVPFAAFKKEFELHAGEVTNLLHRYM